MINVRSFPRHLDCSCCSFSLNTHKVAAFLNLVWYFTANFNYSRQEMNVVTLFSGCGGLDLSFHQLGSRIQVRSATLPAFKDISINKDFY